MVQQASAIEGFLRNFERLSGSANVVALVPQFSDPFLFAGPQGAKSIRTADFALAIPNRKQLFDRLGWQSTELVSLEENRLDSRFVMARAQWRMTFARDGAGSEDVVVGSMYLVDTAEEPFKIVLYLAHQDIMAILRERGILPG